jgi:hypothetical protein
LPEEEKEGVVDLTGSQVGVAHPTSFPPAVNVLKGIGCYYVDKILEEQQKDVGQKQ